MYDITYMSEGKEGTVGIDYTAPRKTGPSAVNEDPRAISRRAFLKKAGVGVVGLTAVAIEETKGPGLLGKILNRAARKLERVDNTDYNATRYGTEPGLGKNNKNKSDATTFEQTKK